MIMLDSMPPHPRPSDTIYLPTSAYIGHGQDDFLGGQCTVACVRPGISGGQPCVYVSVHERPGWEYNWSFLAPQQEGWRERYGTQRGRRDPDPVHDAERA